MTVEPSTPISSTLYADLLLDLQLKLFAESLRFNYYYAMDPGSTLPIGSSTLTSSPAPVLCQDVIDCIIDCSDKKMLSTCSLVCRDWALHSQAQLLRSILLKEPDRFSKFMTALPALSQKAQLLIHELILGNYMTHIVSSSPITLSEEQLALLLELLPNLSGLALDSVTLSSDFTQRRSNVPQRSLRSLHLFSVTNDAASWHSIREIIAFVSHFESIGTMHISINPNRTWVESWQDERTVATIRADMSWATNISSLPSPSSLILKGPATTHLHFMRFFRMSSNRHVLRKIDLAVLDPDITAELELLLKDNSARMEHLALTFSTNRHHNPFGALKWTIDASLLTHLRTIRLRYLVHIEHYELLVELSLRRWMQLLYFLDHFSSAPVEFIIFDLYIAFMPCPTSSATADDRRRILAPLSWTKFGAALQSFKNLKKVHVRLSLFDHKERSFAVEYLELVAKGLGSLKAEGKAVFDWQYYDKTERRIEEFRFP
ncbi:hypothetical protein EIP86_011167 [Pleurotus ostreatoroseus]|nr:hypothetical protein EIP86_011167 [Pleurotus ostreatoroseus]